MGAERVGCGEEWRLEVCYFCHRDFAGLGDFPCGRRSCRARQWDRLRCPRPECGRPGRAVVESDVVEHAPPAPLPGAFGEALLQVPEVAALVESDASGTLSQAGLRALLLGVGVADESEAFGLWHGLVTFFGRERQRAAQRVMVERSERSSSSSSSAASASDPVRRPAAALPRQRPVHRVRRRR